MYVVQKTYYIVKLYFSKPISLVIGPWGWVANNCSENIDKWKDTTIQAYYRNIINRS